MHNKKWLFEISPKNSLFNLNIKEIWQYRDLLLLFVKRDVITKYKQTILGPLWYIIQPLFTSIIFTLIFNNIANIPTNSIPPFLFNLAGITTWNYFKDCLLETSDTFKKNEGIFGKVYFPRAIMPMSVIVSNLIKFGIQLLIFSAFFIYFYSNGMQVDFSLNLMYLPVLIFSMGILGLGFGMIISSMVTKYRDLTFLISFGVQLLMYLSAVVYPVEVAIEKMKDYPIAIKLIEYNPMTTIIESFRNIVFFDNSVLFSDILYMILISLFVFILGLIIFNKTERSFIDTI